MNAPPEWLVISTINNLQRYAKNQYNPTEKMIAREVRKRSGISYQYDIITDVLGRLAEERVLLRSSGDYYRSVRWKIHPDYIPNETIGGDPYTLEERTALAEAVRLEEEQLARHKIEAAERKKEYRREKAAIERAAKNRKIARTDIDPDKQLKKIEKWIESPEVMEILEADPGSVLILDAETTGLSPVSDDILELSIINGSGVTLHTSRYNSWYPDWSEEAQLVNRITPEMVRDLPTFESDAPKISGLLRRASVLVGYNICFDLDFLACSGVKFPAVPVCDVMEDFAVVYGEWADWIDDYGGWKWQRLTTAGKYYDIDITGAHGSLKDCLITLAVMKKIAKEPESKRHRSERRRSDSNSILKTHLIPGFN